MMIRHVVAGGLAAWLSSSSLFAADIKASVMAAARTAAKEEAAGEQQTRMHPAFKWVGIGLIAQGSVAAVAVLALKDSTCRTLRNSLTDRECDTLYNNIAGAEVGFAVAGVVVLAVGTSHHRLPVNNLTFGPRQGGWIVQQKIRF